MTLEEAYHLALANEEQIKIAGKELAKAQLLPWRAYAQLTPNTNILGTYTRNKAEIFFTRQGPGGPGIYGASRKSKSKAFGKPERIATITGFAEAPSISPDAKSLYYHKNEGGVFVIYRVTRP